MEIHAPEEPIHSLRDFLLHLLTVTIGILIALSLEGLLEWHHHRELVREARSNIVSEIRDNQRELAGSLKNLDTSAADQRTVLQFLQDVLTSGKSNIHGFRINASLSQLNDASWRTAQAVGALSFMPYNEVKSYAAVYQLQDDYVRLQTRTLDSVVAAQSTFVGIKDPAKLPHQDLQKEEIIIRANMAQIAAQTQIGKAVLSAYEQILKQAPKD